MTDDKVAISPKPCLQLQNLDHADFYQPFVSSYCCVIEVVLDLEKDDITLLKHGINNLDNSRRSTVWNNWRGWSPINHMKWRIANGSVVGRVCYKSTPPRVRIGTKYEVDPWCNNEGTTPNLDLLLLFSHQYVGGGQC